MIEVEMPKDISKVETKLMGLITPKQLAALVVAVVLTLGMRKLIGDNPKLQDLKSVLTLVTCGVPLSFTTKPYGMPMHEFIIQYLYTNILSSKKRVYKTENTYKKMVDDEKKHEDFIIYQYDRMHKIKHHDAKIDPKEMPKVKKCRKKSLTGYI